MYTNFIILGGVVAFYLFDQNNSGGVFAYDETSGISTKVYVESDSAKEANEKAEEIGIYFDSYFDCSCCGGRWNEISDNEYFVDESTIPTKNAILERDDNKERSYLNIKWLKDGEAEVFVHLKDGSFYGAHQHINHIKRKITGYAGGFTSVHVNLEVIGVGDDGYDPKGEYSCYLAPKYHSYSDFEDSIIYNNGKVKVMENDSYMNNSSKVYQVYGKSKKDVSEFLYKMRTIVDDGFIITRERISAIK